MAGQSNPLKGLVRWIADQFVRDVPADDALCVFDCKTEQCTVGEWATCNRRLHRAAGELMPDSGQEPSPEANPVADEIEPEKRASSPSSRKSKLRKSLTPNSRAYTPFFSGSQTNL